MRKFFVWVMLSLLLITAASCKKTEAPTIHSLETASVSANSTAVSDAAATSGSASETHPEITETDSSSNPSAIAAETTEAGTVAATTLADPSSPVFDSSDFLCDSDSYCVLSDSGEVLLGRDYFTSYAPASITKIMTLLVTVEKVSLTEKVVVLEEDLTDGVEVMSSGVYPSLKPMEVFTVEDLLQMLIMPSTNAAGNVLARYVGGTKENFVAMMNQKLEELGLTHSHFMNPHGLDQEGHYVSAYDMTRIMKACMDNEICARILQTKSYTVPATDYTEEREMYSSNPFINESYTFEQVLGSKSGFTLDAGSTLVTCIERNHQKYYICTLHSEASRHYDDTMRLAWLLCKKLNITSYDKDIAYVYNLYCKVTDGYITVSADVTQSLKSYEMIYWNEELGTDHAVFSGEVTASGNHIERTLAADKNGLYTLQFFPVTVNDEKITVVKTLFYTGQNHENQIVSLNGKNYYIDEFGYVKTGVIETKNGCYYAADSSALSYGFVGGRFYAGPDGKVVTGWFTVDYEKYYAGADGRIVTGDCIIGNKLYHFDKDGMLQD